MTRMKSYRMKPFICQMLKRITEEYSYTQSESNVLEQCIWDKYEKVFGVVSADKIRELEEEWMKAQEQGKD